MIRYTRSVAERLRPKVLPFTVGRDVKLLSLWFVTGMRHRTAILLALALLAAAQSPPTPLLKGADVLSHIKNTIAWYRHLGSVEQTPALSNDVLLRENTHRTALKAVELAFDFGRGAVALADTSAPGPAPVTGAPGSGRNLAQAAARAATRVDNLKTRLSDLEKALDNAKGAARDTIRAQRDTVQAELTLATQVRETISTLAAFSPTTGSGGLATQIDELERTVPEAAHGARPPTANSQAANSQPGGGSSANASATNNASMVAPFHPESTGIIGLATELFALAHNRTQIRDLIGATDELSNSLEHLRTPILNEVRALVRRSEDLGTISGDESVQQLTSDRRDIEALAARFKQLSAVTIPLGEQRIVLGGVRGNLGQARDSISAQYTETGRYLLLRLAILGVAIGAVVLVSLIWRRITFRYIRDARRRTQFLTLRRVVVACAITIVVVLSFVSEFGSLATYAGLLTAGIAVALQNVILSVVAYFFLIGRYGVRTGDRVTISGVTGTVIDIGLVRIYLAELAGSGGEWHPTGRVVVYSNSVLFQPSALFKQMPETDYVWHTVRLVLTSESDYHLAETKIADAVAAVYQKYRQGIEQQHARFERAVDAQMTQPEPEVRLRYSESGLEALVYYPAQIKQAALTDSEIVRALESAIAQEPGLELAKTGSPRVVANAA